MINIMKPIGTNKTKAIELRLQGRSYNEISLALGVAKSTLSYWVRNLSASDEITQVNISKAKRIWSKNISEYNRNRSVELLSKRASDISRYSDGIETISDKELFFLGIGLYLAEGGKSEKYAVRFANSDPEIISIIITFFIRFCELPVEKINARIHSYNTEEYPRTLEYWSNITGIPKNNFWRPQLQVTSSSKFRKPSNKLKHGTLHLTICDKEVNKKVYGWMQGVKLQYKPR